MYMIFPFLGLEPLLLLTTLAVLYQICITIPPCRKDGLEEERELKSFRKSLKSARKLFDKDFLYHIYRIHDHIVLTFNNESQFKEIVNAFIKRGIDRNEINVFIIYRKEEQKFLESLDKFPNINTLLNSQDIMIIPADESFHNGSFSIEPVVKGLRSIEELAKEKSKKRVEYDCHSASQINRTG